MRATSESQHGEVAVLSERYVATLETCAAASQQQGCARGARDQKGRQGAVMWFFFFK